MGPRWKSWHCYSTPSMPPLCLASSSFWWQLGPNLNSLLMDLSDFDSSSKLNCFKWQDEKKCNPATTSFQTALSSMQSMCLYHWLDRQQHLQMDMKYVTPSCVLGCLLNSVNDKKKSEEDVFRQGYD